MLPPPHSSQEAVVMGFGVSDPLETLRLALPASPQRSQREGLGSKDSFAVNESSNIINILYKNSKEQKASSLPPGVGLGNGPLTDVIPNPRGRRVLERSGSQMAGHLKVAVLLCILKMAGDGPVGVERVFIAQ